MDQKKDHISVSVRIRPVLSQDSTASSSLQIISKEPPVLLVIERSQTYHFDNIFPEDVDQEKVYNDAVKPFIENVKKGFNCTVFAYGQTGTGKTYTMGSGSQKPDEPHHVGIIPRALEQLFTDDKLNNEGEIDVFVSFSEIYNEKVFDLLQIGKKMPLPVSGFMVQGLSMKNVRSVEEAQELLEFGNKNRHVGETKMNANSSRSHAIFTVYFTVKNSLGEITGKLNLVDLAGSESVRKTGSKGSTFQEGININKGLLSIGQVVSALSMRSSYVPYRQSMITSILQGSLNVDNYISLIACVCANPDDIIETLQTLDFAQRAKKVRSNPEVNQLVAKYKKENPNVFGSARTPMKRPNLTPLKTPAAKRMTVPLLPLINESSQSQLSNIDNSKSQFSINVSGVSAVNENDQQHLSPMIRKYITKMEVSIMDRLETVIKSTLRRPTRASLLAEKSRGDAEKENTPKVRWSKIQNEVSKMVKNEIAQLSTQTVRATSSPIEEKELLTARRMLNYDSPDSLNPSPHPEPAKSTPQDEFQVNFPFKVPQIPNENNKKTRRSKISISPIENEMPKLTPRRSLRLSQKPQIINNDDTLDLLELSFDSKADVTTRQSQMPIKDQLEDVEVDDLEESCNVTIQKPRRKGAKLAKKRHAVCCATPSPIHKRRKNIRLKIAKTPSKMLVERALKNHRNKDSPYTAHSKKVLKVLNQGTQKEVEKLHSVGAKTAEQILLYRKLKGSFEELEDLSKVPGWGTRKYEKFVNLNFLKKD